ncbi:MAG: acyl-CoA dehydrogenase family protein, partial [Aeromicrobium sp.]
MPVGVTRDHLELSSTLLAWATGLGGPNAVREVETDAHAAFAKTWQSVIEMGLTGIGIGEQYGGGGGELLDQMVATEAAAHALIPGPLLGTILVGQVVAQAAVSSGPGHLDEVLSRLAGGSSAAVALDGAVALDDAGARGDLGVVLDVVDARWLLVPADDGSWALINAEGWSAEPAVGIDLSRRGGRVSVTATTDQLTRLPGVTTEAVRRVLVALAAAEAAGLAQWCLDTAVAYAKVREQFGAPIGSFQAVKHLCAGMLETTESVAAVAWDLGSTARPDVSVEDAEYACDVAATIALDGAVSVARDCIQVLGGIGFTFEHDAHLYLRRAVALSVAVAAMTGGAEKSAARLARRAGSGQRRVPEIDFGGADAQFREKTRLEMGAIAGLHVDE